MKFYLKKYYKFQIQLQPKIRLYNFTAKHPLKEMASIEVALIPKAILT